MWRVPLWATLGMLCLLMGRDNTVDALGGSVRGATGGARRKLQADFEYSFGVELLYTFDEDFDELPEGSELMEEVNDIVRLTRNLYLRITGAEFPLSYWDVDLTYDGGEEGLRVGEDMEGRMTLALDVVLTASFIFARGMPSMTTAMEAFDDFDRPSYIAKYVALARPGNFATR